jgi:hypothetical protein
MFDRFGFNGDHTAAISFLFFATDTYFMKTTFSGLSKSLRLDESSEERFDRHLRKATIMRVSRCWKICWNLPDIWTRSALLV